MKSSSSKNGPYYKHFNKFVEFFGRHDFADMFVDAAFSGKVANYSAGKQDFTGYDREAKEGTSKVVSAIRRNALRRLRSNTSLCSGNRDGDFLHEHCAVRYSSARRFYYQV
jgi:hypothetical protein